MPSDISTREELARNLLQAGEMKIANACLDFGVRELGRKAEKLSVIRNIARSREGATAGAEVQKDVMRHPWEGGSWLALAYARAESPST